MESNPFQWQAVQGRNGVNIFITPARQIDDDPLIGPQRRCQLGRVGQGVAAFQRRDDALSASQRVKPRQRFLVVDGDIVDPTDILEPGMFRPHAGIIQSRRNGMRRQNLAVGVTEQIGAVAVQHTGPTRTQGGGVVSLNDTVDTNEERHGG